MANKFLIALGTFVGTLVILYSFIYVKQQMSKTESQVFMYLQPPKDELLTNIIDGVHSSNPLPKQPVLENMSEKELEILLHTYVSSPQATCSSVVRMGKIIDGGWEVCLDPRYAPDPRNCLVYSFGIAGDFSFDDAMEQYGCEVHSFDPSMGKTKEHLRGKNVHFHPEGIGNKDGQILNTWKLNTLGGFRKRFGHAVGQRKLDILKMDVEGAEKDCLPEMFKSGSVADVPQICFEMHKNDNKGIYLEHLEILRESYDQGMRIFMTNRNLRCLFNSKHTGLRRTRCLEVYTVNITLARQIV